MKRCLAACVFLCAASAQGTDNVQPPASETVLLMAVGKGKQIYTCKAGANGGYEWVLLKPDATLFSDDGERIGKHYEGPTWEASDGSKVVGEVQQRAAAPQAGAIPWLLLKAKSHEGTGMFSRVTFIQRLNTVGGAAPAQGCDQTHSGAQTAVQYRAEYYFYGARR